MANNILITGAGGYIGGSILTDFVNGKGDLKDQVELHAAVRSKEQEESLEYLKVNILKTDLSNGESIVTYILDKKINIVIHTATSIDAAAALNIISALGKRKQQTGKSTYFINTSGLSAFDENTGWTFGEVKDTDFVLDMERKSADSYIVRHVDVVVSEAAKAQDVTFFNVMPPNIHGRGTGPWNKLSPQIPCLIRGSLTNRKVHKFAEERTSPFVHISDLTSFYANLVNAIMHKEDVPSDENGYYFVVSHRLSWWDILSQMAMALSARGLVDDDVVGVWESEDQAAETLNVPAKFAHSIFNSGSKVVGESAKKVGWAPVWNHEKMLQSVDDEINDVLELGVAKSSLLGSLNPSKQRLDESEAKLRI